MGDRDFTKNGLTSELFGKNARIPRGPAVFAYRLASAVVPAFMVREADDTFRLVFEEPLFADASKDEASSVEELMKRYVAVMEAYIRKYPTQWYAFKSIWERDAEEDMRPDTII
jgi:KDO2-lipid IV(A) lauroyltransferase